MGNFTKYFNLVFAALLLVLIFPLQNSNANSTAPTWISPVDYLALGDSLAVGITPNNELGIGYADYLNQYIQIVGASQSYNKGFSYPGYTTTDVLRDIQEDVVRDVIGIGYESETAQIKEAIAEAEIITISAGANDVLKHVNVDAETGGITVDQAQLFAALQQVGKNTQAILHEINELNSDAQVYVMGYYNPFPYLADSVQPLLGQLLRQLNLAISSSIVHPNAIFIETGDEIAKDFSNYLPNPANIHLNEAGYQKVAELFWNEMKSYPWISENALVADEITVNSVQLSWEPATNLDGIANYDIYQGEEKVATVASDQLTYTVDGLTDNTDYHFSVVAVDESGNESNLSPDVHITTANLEHTFSDVKEKEFIPYIEKGVALNIIKGYDDGTFKPRNSLTRAQATSILTRALGLQTDELAPFPDIRKIKEDTQAEISAAYAAGLVRGNDGNFMPDKNVTRAQMALMIHRAIEYKTGESYNASEKAPYSDFGKYDDATVNAISVLYELGIASGSDGKFMPNNATSRQQAMKIFVNTLDILELAN